jgi:sec-independent protein translocase protein TatB
MFSGLSFEHLLILLIAGLFILGPERLPQAAAWLGRTLHKVRTFASDTQQQLRVELGPEFDELRKPLQDFRSLRAMNPRTMVEGYLFDDHGIPSPNTTAERPHDEQPLGVGQRPPFDSDAT